MNIEIIHIESVCSSNLVYFDIATGYEKWTRLLENKVLSGITEKQEKAKKHFFFLLQVLQMDQAQLTDLSSSSEQADVILNIQVGFYKTCLTVI